MISQGMKLGKIIDLGMELGEQKFRMLVTITPDEKESKKLGIQIKLTPIREERYLPPNTQLTLYSQGERMLQSTESREQDNYIQLEPFQGTEGIEFIVGVSLGDVRVREYFEL